MSTFSKVVSSVVSSTFDENSPALFKHTWTVMPQQYVRGLTGKMTRSSKVWSKRYFCKVVASKYFSYDNFLVSLLVCGLMWGFTIERRYFLLIVSNSFTHEQHQHQFQRSNHCTNLLILRKNKLSNCSGVASRRLGCEPGAERLDVGSSNGETQLLGDDFGPTSRRSANFGSYPFVAFLSKQPF